MDIMCVVVEVPVRDLHAGDVVLMVLVVLQPHGVTVFVTGSGAAFVLLVLVDLPIEPDVPVMANLPGRRNAIRVAVPVCPVMADIDGHVRVLMKSDLAGVNVGRIEILMAGLLAGVLPVPIR